MKLRSRRGAVALSSILILFLALITSNASGPPAGQPPDRIVM